MNKSNQVDHDLWKAHVDACDRHPKGARAYCREKQIDCGMFYYWRRKLRLEETRRTRSAVLTNFVPVAIEREQRQFQNLPDALWLADFAVELIRGLSR